VKTFVRDCPIFQKENPRQIETVTAPFTQITLKPIQRINVCRYYLTAANIAGGI